MNDKPIQAAYLSSKGIVNPPLPAEACHYYDQQGNPVYEVPRASGEGMRPTTLADARKLNLVPSVTTILACAAKPGLEAWKARQILEAALTLPRHPTETLDDYAQRVIEDSKQQGKKAAEKGTELHAAFETYIQYKALPLEMDKWSKHCCAVQNALDQYGINILQGEPEHSFASPLGYGGKIDWHNNEIIIDFKNKANLKSKQLAYPEHCWQLAAYASGIWKLQLDYGEKRRLINVFIGIDDCEVRIHEWTRNDYQRSWEAFSHLFSFWQITKNWNGTKQ